MKCFYGDELMSGGDHEDVAGDFGGGPAGKCRTCPMSAATSPRWSFHKYLLDQQDRVVASFPGEVSPQDERLIVAIETLL